MESRAKVSAQTAQRILVRSVNWLGDVVMTLPALHAIRRAYPNAHLAILARPELTSFFDGAAWVDETMALPARPSLRSRWNLARK
ncbi:MAG TPA: thioredoxin family protein, partial [Candidatus Acidoferrales bacterium]|nr:thioredoxin family protein [Candidatus Acidoferrales bacterium]